MRPGYYIHCMAAYTEYDMTINPFAVGIATYVHDAHVVVILLFIKILHTMYSVFVVLLLCVSRVSRKPRQMLMSLHAACAMHRTVRQEFEQQHTQKIPYIPKVMPVS